MHFDDQQRIAVRNWHVEVHDEGEALVELLMQLRACPAPLVIDHLGRPGADAAANDAVERAIAACADAGAVFVKVSAPSIFGISRSSRITKS